MSAGTLVWLIVFLIGLADSIVLSVQGMSLDWNDEWRGVLLLSLSLALSYLLKWRRQPQAARFTLTLTQFIAFAHVGTILTYALTAASPFPMADSLFEREDIALGFHWLPWFQWINRHSAINVLLVLAYNSMVPQFTILTALFSYDNAKRVDELLVASMVAIIIIFPVMYLLPSVGAFAPHGIADGKNWETDILQMRSHTVFVIHPWEGIVTFPSYHTVLGILFINMARGIKWLFYPLLMLNALLMASVMNVGGHYLVDVVGGVAVAVLALSATQYLLARRLQEAKAGIPVDSVMGLRGS